MVAACRAGRLSQLDTRRFVTSFLEAEAKTKSMASSRPKRGTGQCGHCGLGTLLQTPHPWVGALNARPHLPPYLLSLASIGESQAVRLDFWAWAGLGIKVKVRLDSFYSEPSFGLGVKLREGVKGGVWVRSEVEL